MVGADIVVDNPTIAAVGGSSVGDKVPVGLGRGSTVLVGNKKGIWIEFNGLRALTISGGTRSGLKRTMAMTAADNSNRDHNKTDKKRRPFLFLRRGLNTGNSSSEEACAFNDLKSTTGLGFFSDAFFFLSSNASGGRGCTTKSPGSFCVFVLDPSKACLNSSAV